MERSYPAGKTHSDFGDPQISRLPPSAQAVILSPSTSGAPTVFDGYRNNLAASNILKGSDPFINNIFYK
jgi:hypothetical protein